MTQRSRRFCFTMFDMEFNYDKLKKEASYLVTGKETCPTTQKSHDQGYVEFDTQRTLSSVIKKLNRSHVEIAKGSGAENRTYCLKGGDPGIEMGTMTKVQGHRTDLDGLLTQLILKPELTSKELIEMNPAMWARNYKAIAVIKDVYSKPRDWLTEVVYIWGPSGTGKTRYAMELGATKVWFKSDFFSGYDGESIVLFDDVDKWTFHKNRNVLLELLDRYAYRINIKGGSMNWAPRKIFITSNFPPVITFEGEIEGRIDPAISRRISNVIELEPGELFDSKV